jgi:hypothetical protein
MIVMWPARGSDDEAAAMYPDKDRELLRLIRAASWNRNPKVQTVKVVTVLLRFWNLALNEQSNFILKPIWCTVARGTDVRSNPSAGFTPQHLA